MGDEPSALMELGLVGAPFGVRGWVKLRSFTDPPGRLFDHRLLQLRLGGGQWRGYKIESTGRSGGQLTVKFVGVEDRDAAQGLRGASIAVARSELPPPSSKDFYRADLIGCEVVNVKGVRLGIVQHFVEIPAHALMVVRGDEEHWVPAIPQHLRQIDLPARRIVVDWL